MQKRHGVITAGRHELIEVVSCDNEYHSGCTVVRSLEKPNETIHLPTTALGVLIEILRKVPQP